MQDPNDWRYDGVYGVAAAGLITGYDNGLFGVDDSLSTAQLITILWRYAEPEASSNTDPSAVLNKTYLIDVEDFQYYTAAVNWAFENGVVHGMQTPQGYILDPNSPVSTERAMTILANYLTKDEPAMSAQEVDGFLLKCTDGSSVSEWARPSMAWALKTRMISGYDTASGREIRPWENIARGRFAVILNNGMETGALPPNNPGIIPD
ncbi:S-layer homology domain-containing protein [Collinsella ihumii]|uniref:S-layer homology domain-containing protein n=1 Tax=Collinsella ihumii TaxID=1720204 RepID=UPI0025AB23F8|nr:S-layer homology domain-containing protein [Collinsella ihumii]MDN0056572.1 S-layer homology domain-containing protein [Collinsella ihumii]